MGPISAPGGRTADLIHQRLRLLHRGEVTAVHAGDPLGATSLSLRDDGSYVAGRLRSYSRAAEDVVDRELTLTGPILYRAKDAHIAAPLPDVGTASVSARHLVLLTVSYEE